MWTTDALADSVVPPLLPSGHHGTDAPSALGMPEPNEIGRRSRCGQVPNFRIITFISGDSGSGWLTTTCLKCCHSLTLVALQPWRANVTVRELVLMSSYGDIWY